MSVESGRTIGFRCDTCSNTHDSQAQGWNAAVESLTAAGWLTTPSGHGELHQCPQCIERAKRKAAA